MKSRSQPKSPTARMRAYRERLRNQGLRPVQIWVPDPKSPVFRRELRRQVARLDAAHEVETLAFIAADDDTGS